MLLVALARLVRIEYCTLGAVGVLLGAFLTTNAMPTTPVLLSAVAVFFVGAGCYAFDDLYDLDCDRLNDRTDRPLVTSTLSPRAATITGGISFVLAIAAAVLAGTASGLLIGLGAVTAMAYNRWLRGAISLKNVLFAAAFPVPLLVGWLAGGGSPGPLFLYFVGLVFIAGLGFETMIDVADSEGDRRAGVITFATRYGTLLSSQLAAGFHIAAAILVVLLFFLPVDPRLQWNILFLGLAVAAALSNSLIGVRLVRDHTTPRVFVLKRLAFLTLNAGMAAILLGLLFTVP
jgi:4-hydroxybenzoate polyprenyltransferase